MHLVPGAAADGHTKEKERHCYVDMYMYMRVYVHVYVHMYMHLYPVYVYLYSVIKILTSLTLLYYFFVAWWCGVLFRGLGGVIWGMGWGDY